MSDSLYIKELSSPFIFTNRLLCRNLKAITPIVSEGECILSALPASFNSKGKPLKFPPIIFYMLTTCRTSSVLIDGTILTANYDTPFEYLQEILTHFGTSLVSKQTKPRRLLVDTTYTYHFLISFCEKCGIELKLVEELKHAYQFISTSLLENGADCAVIKAMKGNIIEMPDYFETPEEFFAIYYPKFMKSNHAKMLSKDQLIESRPYIELFSKKMWDDEGELPFEWSGDSLKKIASLILHGDLKLQPNKSATFLHVLAIFLQFLDTAFECNISSELLPAIGKLHIQ